MNASIVRYSPSNQQSVKKLILEELLKFGFPYNPQYDYDLDDPEKFYIKKGGMFFVLKNDEDLLGTIAVINHGNHAELKRMYIKEKYQAHGFGAKLLEEAIRFCKKSNLNAIKLETNKKFLNAHKFYLKHGFKIIDEDENSYYMEKNF